MFNQPDADIFVPDGTSAVNALARTTHLCIGAHQDDAEFMALHGILDCFHRPDRHFTCVTVTNGSGSARCGVYGDYTDEQMRAVRVQEQRKAAFVGEYAAVVQLMYPSAAVKQPANQDVHADLVTLFDTCRPEVVYLHNPADKHDTHVACCLRAIQAMRALSPDARPHRVLGCEIWRDLDWLADADKQLLPVDRHENLAAALSGVFDSQITGGKRYDSAIAGRRKAHATFFESHATDKTDALSFAMDLTPLLQDAGLSVTELTMRLIERFRADVEARINRFA